MICARLCKNQSSIFLPPCLGFHGIPLVTSSRGLLNVERGGEVEIAPGADRVPKVCLAAHAYVVPDEAMNARNLHVVIAEFFFVVCDCCEMMHLSLPAGEGAGRTVQYNTGDMITHPLYQ